MTTTPNPHTATDDVIDAMRSLQTEGDRWNLAEKLLVLVPRGNNGFGDVLDLAAKAGVKGKFKPDTLRLYRDTAHRWPADQRVDNVSFSAHREAMVLNDVNSQVRTLNDLVKTHGASAVTVKRVREAVRIKQGKPAPKSKDDKSVAFDALADLQKGAPNIIAAITSSTTSDELDKLHAGLTKALGHVERLRTKAARKAQAAAKKAATPAKASGAVKKATPGAKARAAGDTRGL
jgi:hypothetical protein